MRILVVLLGLLAGAYSVSLHSVKADTLYFNGSILTMAGKTPEYVEAVAVAGKDIIFAGTEEAARKKCNSSTRMVDLKGNTMLPGFIEPHSHFTFTTLFGLSAHLDAPPVGNITKKEQLVETMRDWVKNNKDFINKTGWIFGTNYDERAYPNHSPPTRKLLDEVSTEYPILIAHQSLHVGVVNSKALALLGINESFVDPTNGIAQREPGTKIPNGILEEAMFVRAALRVLKSIPYEFFQRNYGAIQQNYIRSGFTTITDGRTDPFDLRYLVRYIKEDKLNIDVVSYIDYAAFFPTKAYLHWTKYFSKMQYFNHFRIGGGKLSLDGSLQSRTGWLKQPYYHVNEGKKADFKGYPSWVSVEQVANMMTTLRKRNLQINVHVNGDAAVEQLIDAVVLSRRKFPSTTLAAKSSPFNFTNLDNERVVGIHCQYTTEDQTARMKENHIIPSYFSAHIPYWGDWHRTEILGPKRAQRLSVAGEALKNGMLFTAHLDSPVVPPRSMTIISSLVNRKTSSGVVLGEEFKVPVYQAFLSITRYAAYQIFEQSTKGSIEVGHVADFVIMKENPLKVKPEELINLKVERTIKHNKEIYQSADSVTEPSNPDSTDNTEQPYDDGDELPANY